MNKFIAIQIVPTGVGAAIGGFVGDATPATNVIASIADTIITHPNVVNGVTMELARKNSLYVEGYTLDRFFKNEIVLREVRSNKLGVIIDKGYENKKSFDLLINTIDAIRTVKGVNVIDYIETKKPVGGKAVKTKTNSFVGKIKDARVFLNPARKLLKAGANAIAVSTRIKVKPKDFNLYIKGKGACPYGGAEAIISHTISKVFNIPSAHAPMLSLKEIKMEMFSGIADARAGAEAMGPAYLGCVLQGLHNAPQPISIKKKKASDISLKDVAVVILPYSCMGGIPGLSAQKNKIPIIAVKENKT